MSTTLLVLLPVALLFIVSGLCFIGCALSSKGEGPDWVPPDENPKPPETKPYTKYSDDVINDPSIVAYWPLSEPKGHTNKPVADAKAVDVIGGKNGNYNHMENAGVLFPCPATQISPVEPMIDSALAIGSLSLGTESIVAGNAKQPGNDPNVLSTGMQVDGAFVSVPVLNIVNPSSFTVEAWVRPEWKAGEPAATRAIVDSRGFDVTVTGFVLWVNNDGNWEALFNGTNSGPMRATGGPAALGDVAHVVLTFDGTNASVFINGGLAGGPSALPPGSTFAPNTTEPFIIGAGFRFLGLRTEAKEEKKFPLIPWNGTIQDVALYDTVLKDEVIKTHYSHGKGEKVPVSIDGE